jgi:protein gp37
MAVRLAGNPKMKDDYQQVITDGKWSGRTLWRPQVLEKVSKWKQPKRIFVCSMSDPFHESVPWEWLLMLKGFFAAHPQHTFILLTKRPWRAVKFQKAHAIMKWPENVWMGVSVCDQSEVGKIKILAQMNVAVRFVSIEPMLGEIDLWGYLADIQCGCGWLGFVENDTPEGGLKKMYKGEPGWDDHGEVDDPNDEGWWVCPKCGAHEYGDGGVVNRGYCGWDDIKLDWVICGGETGPGARPMKEEWVRKLHDQCKHAGVPFFFKGWGGVRKRKDNDLIGGRRYHELPRGRA